MRLIAIDCLTELINTIELKCYVKILTPTKKLSNKTNIAITLQYELIYYY